MTLSELEHSLPNGLHDSEIERFTIDYKKAAVSFDLLVWVGEPGGPELYRSAILKFSGLTLFVAEPPDPTYPFGGDSLTIGTCSISEISKSSISNQLFEKLATNGFVTAFFVNEWNSFIYIGAQSVSLEWKGSEFTR